jgi:hypothetical protein
MQVARVILLRSANWPKHGFGLWLVRAAQRLHPNVLAAALKFQICAEHSAKKESLDVATLRTNPWSVEARDLYKEGKWIEREVVRETVPKQAEPTILRYIGELLTLLWALVFEAKHILKMMNHLMDENR